MKRRKKQNATTELYVRNVIFGVEDSLVSTVGLLAGIALGGVSQRAVILTGVVLIFVEAFSMGIGSLLSEHSVEEYEAGHEVSLRRGSKGAAAMLFSYLGAGLVPLLPYAFFSGNAAVGVSIIASLAALFMLGAMSGRFFKINIVRQGLEMLLLGGAAIAVGIVVGQFVNI